jgi:ribosome recycling factor
MFDFSKFKKHIAETEEWLKKEHSNVRTGRANPALLDSVRVESYGSLVPISQVGSILIEEPRTLRVSPWDASLIKAAEKAITAADLGVSVATDDKGLRVTFPELTTERRGQFVKLAKDKLEEAKKTLRGHRDDVMKELADKEKAGGVGKDDVFRFKADAQKLVDEANKKLEEQFAKKQKEIEG